MSRTCPGCGLALPVSARPTRLYHDERCRERAKRRRRRGTQATEPAVALAPPDALERLLAEGEEGVIAIVMRAAQRQDWRAAAWIAERAWPERWAPLSQRPKEAEPLDPEAERRAQRYLSLAPPPPTT